MFRTESKLRDHKIIILTNRYKGRFPKRKRKRVRLKVNVYLMNIGSGSEAWPNDHQYNLEPFTLTNGLQRYFRNLLFLLYNLPEFYCQFPLCGTARYKF